MKRIGHSVLNTHFLPLLNAADETGKGIELNLNFQAAKKAIGLWGKTHLRVTFASKLGSSEEQRRCGKSCAGSLHKSRLLHSVQAF